MKRVLLALCLLLLAWQAAAQTAEERIERYRETEITIQVTDDQGHEVPGAQIDMRQTAHAFIFASPSRAELNKENVNAVHEQWQHSQKPFYVATNTLPEMSQALKWGGVIPCAPAGHTYTAMLNALDARHRLPDAIGLDPPGDGWDLARLPQICERFGHYTRPLHVWVGQQPLTATQAEALYTTLFGQSSVGAILWQNPQTLTPAIQSRLENLTRHRWWSEARGVADAAGTFVSRVFYGDYTISVTAGDGRHRSRTLTFPESSGPHRVVVVLSRETGSATPAESLSSR